MDFDSYALKTPEGVIFVDPMKPSPEVLAKLEAWGDPVAVFLTNADHDRDSDWFRKNYEIQIYAHERAQVDCDTKIDVLVVDNEKLPGGVKAIPLLGTTSGGLAYHSKQSGGILMIGDALLNLTGKGLSLLPEQYLEDRKQVLLSLHKLLDLNFSIVTFAHGDPLVSNAKAAVEKFLKKKAAR